MAVKKHSAIPALNSAETAFENWFKPIQNRPIPAHLSVVDQIKLVFLSGYHAARDDQLELDKITCEMIGGEK